MGKTVLRGSGFAASFEASLRRNRYQKRTVRLYVGAIDRLCAWLEAHDKSLAEIDADTLINYADTLPLTYASRNTIQNAFRALWRHHMGKPDPGPADALYVPPRPPMECKAIETDDVRRLLQAARFEGETCHAIVCLLYYAALRREETATLLRSGVEGPWLSVTGKGNKVRTLPVHPELRDALDALSALKIDEKSPYVFPGRQRGTHISTNTVAVWVRVAAARAGLSRVRPHQLRHSAAATMNDTTGDLRATGEFLGHSRHSLAVTQGYTRTTKQRMVLMMETLSTYGVRPADDE